MSCFGFWGKANNGHVFREQKEIAIQNIKNAGIIILNQISVFEFNPNLHAKIL
jgi:hypothetical protein